MSSTYRAHVKTNHLANSVAIYLGEMTDQGLLVVRKQKFTLDPAIPNVESDPAFYLEDGMARALMEALVKHYDFNLDTSTARQDYLYERGRVDKLTTSILGLLDATTSRIKDGKIP